MYLNCKNYRSLDLLWNITWKLPENEMVELDRTSYDESENFRIKLTWYWFFGNIACGKTMCLKIWFNSIAFETRKNWCWDTNNQNHPNKWRDNHDCQSLTNVHSQFINKKQKKRKKRRFKGKSNGTLLSFATRNTQSLF